MTLRKEEYIAKKKHAGGRPVIYDPKDVAAALIKWVKKEDSISLAAFCSEHKYLPDLIWRLEKSNNDFSEAYMIAKMTLAARRENMVNCDMLNYGAFNRYQHMYDPFLARMEENDKDKDAARRKGIVEAEQANLVTLAKMAAQGKISQK